MSDVGLSAQRTRLAWRRTGTSAAVVALLEIRQAVGQGGRVRLLLAAGALLGWMVLAVLAYLRGRVLATGSPSTRHRALPACAGITVAFALIGAALIRG